MSELAKSSVLKVRLNNHTYSLLVNYCKREKITVSGYVRGLVEFNVRGVVPINQAGANRIEYNKPNDSFNWLVDFDDGHKEQLGANLEPEFLEDFSSKADAAIDLRKTYLKKKSPSSVSVSSALKRIVGGKKHA